MKLIGEEGHVNFYSHAFSLVHMECTMYLFGSFEVGVQDKWFSMKVVVYDFKCMSEATESNNVVKGIILMHL